MLLLDPLSRALMHALFIYLFENLRCDAKRCQAYGAEEEEKKTATRTNNNEKHTRNVQTNEYCAERMCAAVTQPAKGVNDF